MEIFWHWLYEKEVVAAFVAAIAAVLTAFIALLSRRQIMRLETPIEGTYNAVNHGRTERIEACVFEIRAQLAQSAGSMAVMQNQLQRLEQDVRRLDSQHTANT